MINLLGEPNHTGPAKYEGLENILREKGTHVHLYGKELTKPHRKMGHLTMTGASIEEAKAKAGRLQGKLRIVS